MDLEQLAMLRGGIIATDFYLPQDRRYARGLRYLLWRSGWVRVIDARRSCSVGEQQRLIVACVDEYGRQVPPSKAKSFFDLAASTPKEAEDIAPEEDLEAVEDELSLGFLIESDRELSEELCRHREAYNEGVQRLEANYLEGLYLLEEHRSQLRRRRLTHHATNHQISGDPTDALQVKLDEVFVAEQRHLRRKMEAMQEQIFSDMELDPTLEVLCTVRWRLVPAERPRFDFNLTTSW